MKHLKFLIILLFIVIFSSTYCISYDSSNSYIWTINPATTSASSSISAEVSSTVNNNNSLNLESGSAILIEQSTGQILYEYNSHKQLRPASVTKLMTILLIMEALDSNKISLTDKVPCSENASNMGGSQIWLDVREELTVDEMLKAICVVSANDCTVAMAEYLCGSEEAFVSKMNEKASELGMNDTCFKNCHGLDTDGHLTSAYDISLMSCELLKKHPSITNYTTIWMDTLRNGKSELTNTNKLIRNYQGATGLKTGSTSLALYNLSASATRNNLSLIAVIMKAPSSKVRFSEAQKLLDYGFNSFSYTSLSKKGASLTSLPVQKGVENFVDVIYENDSNFLLQKGRDKNVEQIISLPESIEAPINQNEKIGEIQYLLDGSTIGITNLIAGKEVKKISLTSMYSSLFFNWFYLLR